MAASKMFISVQPEHIAAGDCKSPQRCMISQAIKTNHPLVSYVSVRTNKITITKRLGNSMSIREHWTVPDKVAREIIRFDQNDPEDPVQPFSFWSKLVDQTKIPPVSAKQRKADKERTEARRAALAAVGQAPPKYGRRSRVAGV